MKATAIFFSARFWLAVVCWAGALAAVGDISAAESRPAIDLSRCYGPFRSESYLEVAAALQALPEAERVALLRAWAAEPGDRPGPGKFNEQVIMLCLMLFQSTHEEIIPTSSGHVIVHVPRASQASGRADGRLKSLLLADGIPFALGGTGGSGPSSEQADSFLENCLQNYGWSSQRYAPVSLTDRQKAMEVLMSNYPWRRPPDARATQSYAEQAKDYSPPTLKLSLLTIRGGRDIIDGEHLQGSGLQLWRIGSVGASVELLASGGAPPYRYNFFHLATGGAPPVALAHGEIAFDPNSGYKLAVPLPSPLPMVNDWLLIEATDAQGQEKTVGFRVTGPDELEIDRRSKTTWTSLRPPLWAVWSGGGLALGWAVWSLIARLREGKKPAS